VGQYNSSITRVWPVLRALLANDPTGVDWIPELLRVGSRSTAVPNLSGALLPWCLEKRPVAAFAKDSVPPLKLELERCFEYPCQPAKAFLRWLVDNPGRMTWPIEKKGRPKVYGAETQANREQLIRTSDPNVRRLASERAHEGMSVF